MKVVVAALLLMVIAAGQVRSGLTHPSTAPAFLWSPHLDGFTSNIMEGSIIRQIISRKDLAKSVVSEGGWSNMLCSRKNVQQPLDIALVFIGRELHSADIFGNKHADPVLVNLLKNSFKRSKFSMAFSYVATSEEQKTIENSLMSGLADICGHDVGLNKVAFLDSCSLEGENYKKLTNMQSVHDFLVSRSEARPKGTADLVVFCHGVSDTLKASGLPNSESETLSQLISSVEQSGAKYAFLYVSDPFRSLHHPSSKKPTRFLAEGVSLNGSANFTTCDGVCLIRSTFLEGILVAIVLLIILGFGLCCMMGIDTPTRFEAPHES